VMLAKAAAVVQKDFLTAVRYRNGVLLSAFAPAMQLLMSFYLAHAVGPQFRPEGISFFNFLLIGTGLFMFLHGCMQGFLNVIQEAQQTGTLEVLMTTSTPPATLLCLAALSAVATAFVQFVLYVAAGLLLFHVSVRADALGAIGVLIVSVIIAVASGIFAAGLQVAVQKGSTVLWLFGSTAWVLAGTLFPVESLPVPLRMLSQWLPFTHSLTAMRIAMFGGSGPELASEMKVLLLFVAVALPLSIAFFSWTVRRARQLGTLSLY
jgi:ABC-2 type transport system permease protein